MPKWMTEGPEDDTIVSTRVRLARNYSGKKFPMLLDENGSKEIIDLAFGAMNGEEYDKYKIGDCDLAERLALVERHVASPDLVRNENTALIVNRDEHLSAMINEEDHLRIQCMLPGLQLENALVMALGFSKLLEKEPMFAFDKMFGYLTCCPTNTGTGMRASLMMHLPAMEMTGSVGEMVKQVQKFGLTVRGMYGEGTDSIGCMYQLSNQITLGVSEKDIINSLSMTAATIMDTERRTVSALMEHQKLALEDKVFRSLGTLKNARSITSQELSTAASNVKLGKTLGLLQGISHADMHNLIIETRPGMLMKEHERALQEDERDYYRAEKCRRMLKNVVETE